MPIRYHTSMRTLAERFWEKVEKTEDCWVWQAALGRGGYGKVGLGGRAGGTAPAHRVSWALARGPIPPGRWVLHHCDNRRCVRPEHLFLGNAADNSADMKAKGRSAAGDRQGLRKHPERASRGEGRWSARLNEFQIMELRAAYAAGGIYQRELALRYGIAQGQVSRIVTGQRWKHIA